MTRMVNHAAYVTSVDTVLVDALDRESLLSQFSRPYSFIPLARCPPIVHALVLPRRRPD